MLSALKSIYKISSDSKIAEKKGCFFKDNQAQNGEESPQLLQEAKDMEYTRDTERCYNLD